MTSGGIAVLYVPDRIHAEVYRRLPKIARYLWTRSAKGAGIGPSARVRRLGPGPQPSASGANVSGKSLSISSRAVWYTTCGLAGSDSSRSVAG